MASAFSALGDFVKSIWELILSMFQTFFGLIETFIKLIVNFFTSVVNLLGDTTKGIFDVLGGVGSFLIGEFSSVNMKVIIREGRGLTGDVIANAAIIAIGAAAFYGYLVYQRRQGNTVQVQGKKMN